MNWIFFFSKKIKFILLITGKGIEYNQEEDNFKFEGEYKKGQKNGKGKEYINNKLIFIGEYINGNGMEKEKNI